MKTSKSEEVFKRAQGVMPGGVNSPVRSFRSVGGRPFIAARAEAAHIYDIDGNKYIDLVCSWGALLHGHKNPEIQAAIEGALERGTSFGITCETEIELGEAIQKAVPSAELVRLVCSGTEACMGAVRVARAFTKRDLIIKFDGHYHGHADTFLVGAGSGLTSLHRSESAGVPESTVQQTLVVGFNDGPALEKVFAEYGDRIAAVILEVVCGNMGTVLPDKDFLLRLRKLTKDSGSVLIFDEVMTGFRLLRGGAQQLYSIEPDMSCFGKVIGGGMPVAAYAGRKDIMQNVAPLGQAYQAGTLSGNPLGAAAGLASLKIIEKHEKEIYQQLDHSGSEWRSQLESHIKIKSYPVSVAQAGSMLSVFFMPQAPKNYAEAKACDLDRFKKFFWSLMNQGVYYPPSQFEACFLSTQHRGPVLTELIEASLKALDEAFGA